MLDIFLTLSRAMVGNGRASWAEYILYSGLGGTMVEDGGLNMFSTLAGQWHNIDKCNGEAMVGTLDIFRRDMGGVPDYILNSGRVVVD